MFFTTIIPTIGRETLSRSVESVLDQSFSGDFEVIVVNDSGSPLPEEDWQRSQKVKILDTNRTERSIARNTGAAVARGKFLHFLDDDDWVLPNAFSNLFQLAQKSQAAWLYGSTQLVNRQGKPLILLKHQMQGNIFVKVMAGEWIPLQSSVLDARAFHRVGGFEQRLKASEDVDLARRMALYYDFDCITSIVACIGMGLENSTTKHDAEPSSSRKGREWILAEQGVLMRLLDSADSSEWRGRVSRLYFTSMLWNARRLRLSTSVSRGILALMSLVIAGKSLLTPSYWTSLIRQYDSVTFARGFQEADPKNLGSNA
jgi:glycosyltransferase involved in cell wall biosynthesis